MPILSSLRNFRIISLRGNYALALSGIAISLSGCILFSDSYDPPEPSEFSPATMVAEANSEKDSDSGAWYNASFLRSWFGDFRQTDTVYITDPESAGALIVRGEKLVKADAACGVCHASKAEDRRCR